MRFPFRFQRKLWEREVSAESPGVRFSQNILVRILAGSGLFLGVLSLGLFFFFIRPTEKLLILHYNIYFGVDLLGLWWQVYILPGLSLLLFIGHFMLARFFYYRKERVAAYLFLLGFVFLALSLLIASIGIVYINY